MIILPRFITPLEVGTYNFILKLTGQRLHRQGKCQRNTGQLLMGVIQIISLVLMEYQKKRQRIKYLLKIMILLLHLKSKF